MIEEFTSEALVKAHEQAYIVPAHCPYCNAKLQLIVSPWQGPQEYKCNCGRHFVMTIAIKGVKCYRMLQFNSNGITYNTQLMVLNTVPTFCNGDGI